MTATKIQPGDDTHLTLLMAPHSLNFVTGPDRAALLAYGRDVFAAARDLKCLAQIEEPARPVAPVLDDRWKARMLDGRAIERDEMGLGDHPELPLLDEGMKPRGFFAALGLELTHTMAEDQLDGDALEAMSEAVNWTDWQPNPPQGDGWKLASIFDTEDGTAAWWLRELPEAEDGTTTIRNLQAEVEKLKARIARAGEAPATFMTDDQARGWAWNKVREDLDTKSWAAGDSSNFYGFFLHGWNYRGQYELQRSTAIAAIKQELMTAAPALEAPAAVEVIGYRISDPGEPDLSFWLSEEPGAAWCKSEELTLAAAPQAQVSAPEWWRKRADEIETQVAATGSSEAMRCYTDMRTLLQSAAAPQAPAAPAVDAAIQAARDAGINHGVCLALQIMASAGNAGSAEWTELLDCVGRAEVMHYAKHVEPENWELCGFAAQAKEGDE